MLRIDLDPNLETIETSQARNTRDEWLDELKNCVSNKASKLEAREASGDVELVSYSISGNYFASNLRAMIDRAFYGHLSGYDLACADAGAVADRETRA